MTTFIDTNVLIYLLSSEAVHHSWSLAQFEKRKQIGPVIVNDIVYAEFSVGMLNKAATDHAIRELACERLRISDQALFNAGRAFKKYKVGGGEKERILPDFFIAAQADCERAALLTGDQRNFTKSFPNLKVISPSHSD